MPDSELPERALQDRDRLFKHLPEDTDLVLIVLKAHLLLEEQLNSVLETSLGHAEFLKTARLTFYQRVRVIRAIAEHLQPERFWMAIEALSTLRNRLAHELEPMDLEKKVQQFLELAGESAQQFSVKTGTRVSAWPEEPGLAIMDAVVYLHSQLTAMRDTLGELRDRLGKQKEFFPRSTK